MAEGVGIGGSDDMNFGLRGELVLDGGESGIRQRLRSESSSNRPRAAAKN